MNLTKLWIFYNIALYAGLGIFTFLKPETMASKMGFELLSPTGYAELYATYGGLLIALGALMLLAFLKLPLSTCLAFIAIIYLGYGSARFIGAITHGAWDHTTMLFLSIEVSSFLITSLMYYFSKD